MMKKLVIIIGLAMVMLTGCSSSAPVAKLEPEGVETILVENIEAENIITYDDVTERWD